MEVICIWGGGRKSITPVQMPEMGWGINDAAGPHFPLRDQYSILPLMSIPESVGLIATTPQTGREGGIGMGFGSANWLLGWKVTLEV